MGKTNRVKLDGREYVILTREEYDRLEGLAHVADLPALPSPDAEGNYPAIDYARLSIARDLVRERAESGISQRELARLAGIRFETLSRIETGKHTASTATLAKLDGALKRAAAQRAGASNKGPRKAHKRQRRAS
ncbi:MAG: helix-turn-helix transcriptional regulator [Planctomycetes bacterium]|nr:helix-turn-helix transcriptional regulator [Planctomycetota bacterium]